MVPNIKFKTRPEMAHKMFSVAIPCPLRWFDLFVGLLVTTWRWWENKCAFWYFNYWVKRVNWHRYGAVLCPPSQFIFQIIYLFMVTITVYCKLEKGKNNNIRVGLSNVAKVQKRSSWYFCSFVTDPNASSDINMNVNHIPL